MAQTTTKPSPVVKSPATHHAHPRVHPQGHRQIAKPLSRRKGAKPKAAKSKPKATK